MKRRVTLNDIARRTGFTVNTVSRALKNMPDISRATCENIQRVADEMGYVRNFFASSLRSGRSRTIAAIVGGMSNPYYAIMTDALYIDAANTGYLLQVMCTSDVARYEEQAVTNAISRQVDGILLCPSWSSATSIEMMRAAGVPFVLLARTMEGMGADAVVCDEEMGGYLATRHLIEAGHRKLAYMESFDVVYSTARRVEGFRRAAREAGVPQGDLHYYHRADDEATRRQFFRWKEEGVTGIFVFCDIESWSIFSLLNSCGLSIPEDFALVGFDNIQRNLMFPTPLCTIDGSMEDMARKALELLRRRIDGDDGPPRQIEIPVELICRGSCGHAPMTANQ